MKIVEPKVFLIAETKVDYDQLGKMLRSLGGKVASDWFKKTNKKATSDGEYLTEVAGRACYKSFGIGLNPNITKIRQSSRDYIINTLSKGDGSIFEHGSCTFAFLNVSRVFTHELVRHRVGVAISQESLRYVRPTDMGIWIPPDLKERKQKIMSVVERIEADYRTLENSYGWEGLEFSAKKKITSALRRILPQGMATNIIWTANHRTIRHVITMRTSEAAEIEIRLVFDKVAQIMKERFPLIYEDFEPVELEDGTRKWVPKYMKV